jgi:predicted lipoprotein with Yx(FWY)xxD motif
MRLIRKETRNTMNNVKVAIAAVLVAVSVASGAAFASTGKATTVSLGATKAGKVLIGANGRTLYAFTADKGGRSACYGKCAAVWPPLLATSPSVGAGLNASMVGTTKRTDGKLQVTYGGHPLYLFAKDKKAGDFQGQGIVHFGGTWWVISAAGTELTANPS